MSAAERLALRSAPETDPRLAALRARIERLVPAPAVAPSVLPTGIPGLDRSLAAGGLVRGAITTLVGPAGAGVTTVWRAIVAATLVGGGRVAVIDATRTCWARDFAGLVPRDGTSRRDRLVFVRPPARETAPWCADLLVRSGAFPLVVLDAPLPLSRAVVSRLAQLARETDTALLVTGDDDAPPIPSGGTVRLRAAPGTAPPGPTVAAPSVSRSAPIRLAIEKGAASPRPIEVSCVLPVPRRLCVHAEVPDRRGASAAGAPAAIRRGRRAAEGRVTARGSVVRHRG